MLFSLIAGGVTFVIGYRAQIDGARDLQDQLVRTVKESATVAAFAGNEQIALEVIEGLLANDVVLGVRIESAAGMSLERRREPKRRSTQCRHTRWRPDCA